LWCPIAVKPKLYIAHHLWGWGEKNKKNKGKNRIQLVKPESVREKSDGQ
jgi:hypothetical protein